MAFTLDQVEQYLKEMGFKFERDNEKDAVLTGVSGDGQSAMIFIRAQENGEMFSLNMEPVNSDSSTPFDIPLDHPHLSLALKKLLLINFQSKFGTWAYDMRDGDLRFSVGFPIQDSTLTKKQFERAMSIIFNALSEQNMLKKILETGKLPEEKIEIPADMAAQFEAFLRAQAAKGTDDGI